MTFEKYSEIWAQTEKAFRYFNKFSKTGGVNWFCDSVFADCKAPCHEKAHLLRYFVGGLTEKQKNHIKNRYPYANVFFAEPEAVFYMESAKRSAYDKYLREESQDLEIQKINNIISKIV